MTKSDFRRVGDEVWEIPPAFRADMRVPVRLYADEAPLKEALISEQFPGIGR